MAKMEQHGDVIVVTKKEETFHAISQVLQLFFGRALQAGTLVQARQLAEKGGAGAVVINAPCADGMGVREAVDFSVRQGLSVLLIVKAEQYDQISFQTRGTGIFLLTRPLTARSLKEASGVLAAMQTRVHLLQAENRRLSKRLDELGLVSRAKCLLIERRHMTEDSAHYYLEKIAMDDGCSKKEAAREVIRRLEA